MTALNPRGAERVSNPSQTQTAEHCGSILYKLACPEFLVVTRSAIEVG
jgi:hypothetical protein